MAVQRKGGKRGRKIGRNFRVDGKIASVTRYRAAHGIPAGSRKANHAAGSCNVVRRADDKNQKTLLAASNRREAHKAAFEATLKAA